MIDIRDVGLIAYDFDGVMTDNRVIVSDSGAESVRVNRSDGLAVSLIRKYGIDQVIISTEKNKVVVKRANKLKIPCVIGTDDKKKALGAYCKKVGVSRDRVIYVGNDINDLEAMMSVAFPVCPADAYKEIQRISKIVLNVNGGDGVVRELLNHINK